MTYGPLIVTLLIAGWVPRLRIRGRSVASSRASVRCTNVTPITLGRPSACVGNSSGPAAAPRPRPPALPPRALADAAGRRPVDQPRRCWIGIGWIGLPWWSIHCRSTASAAERPLGDALAVHEDLQSCPRADAHFHDVRAVHGELAPHRDTAARAEWQFVNALVLRMFRVEAMDVDHHWHRRIANRQPADLPRGIEIALFMLAR